MKSDYENPVQYYIKSDNHFINLNQHISKVICIEKIANRCLFCCEKVKKIYRMGHCYNCFWISPSTNENILKPELSKAHLGIESRDLEWEKKLELQPHIVYLANSSHLKVGVTRKIQMLHRWIDQGANEAIVVAEMPNRYLAGIMEVHLKDYFSDKTSWKKMLKNEYKNINIVSEKKKLFKLLTSELQEYFINNDHVYQIKYPVEKYPENINSINLEKDPKFEGILKGIKGQYLIFECGGVLNVRTHAGALINMTLSRKKIN